MTLPRRRFLTLAARMAAWPALAGLALAQTYPTRPINVIVPFAPGGGTDVATRIVGDHMSRTLGQQLVVLNVPGAGGTVGSTRAMRAEPDGYTILMGQMGTHAAAVALYPSLAYKPETDFEPIGLVAEAPVVIVARKDFPPKDLKEFVAFVKANSQKLNVSHAGVGSSFFTTCLMLDAILGVKPTLVPFNGGAPAMTALVSGQVDYMCGDVLTSAPQLRGGNVKAYAIAAPKRSPMLPDLPTTTEAGLPEYQASTWFGFFAPKGTPKPILDRLSAALDLALDDPEVRRRLNEVGNEVPDKSAHGQEALRALLKREIARWTPIIKAAAVKTE